MSLSSLFCRDAARICVTKATWVRVTPQGFGAELGWLGLGINNAGSGHDWGAHSYFTAIKHAEINLIPPSFWLNWKWSPDFKRFVHVFQLNLFRSLETFSLKTATTSRYTRGRWCSNTKYREVAPSADHLLLLNARGPNLDSALKLPSSSSYSYSSSLGPDSSHNRITADGGNYHLNTYFRHEKQPQLQQNVLSRRYFSLMMFFYIFFFYGASALSKEKRSQQWQKWRMSGREPVRLI